jgi:predicted small metal-binding protein
MNTNAEKLRIAATRCTRHNSDVAMLCEYALAAADRLEVLEDEHMRFFENWHNERRKREMIAEHYRHVCSLSLAAGMLAEHAGGAKKILDEAEKYMTDAADSWRRSNT